MLSCASFAVVVIDDEGPWLIARLEALGYAGDSVRLALRWRVVVVERNIDFSTLIIDSCDDCKEVLTSIRTRTFQNSRRFSEILVKWPLYLSQGPYPSVSSRARNE